MSLPTVRRIPPRRPAPIRPREERHRSGGPEALRKSSDSRRARHVSLVLATSLIGAFVVLFLSFREGDGDLRLSPRIEEQLQRHQGKTLALDATNEPAD